MELIDEHNRFWLQIVGRGGANSNTGKKATNAKTMFSQLFEVTEPVVEEHDDEFNDTEIDNLEKLEENDPLG
jgi:regulator of sigma D